MGREVSLGDAGATRVVNCLSGRSGAVATSILSRGNAVGDFSLFVWLKAGSFSSETLSLVYLKVINYCKFVTEV